MATTTIQFSWRELVLRGNPDHERESLDPVEYEFSSPGGTPRVHGDRTHDGGMRVFRAGNYRTRGAYSTAPASAYGLSWGNVALEWDGEELTWGAS